MVCLSRGINSYVNNGTVLTWKNSNIVNFFASDAYFKLMSIRDHGQLALV